MTYYYILYSKILACKLPKNSGVNKVYVFMTNACVDASSGRNKTLWSVHFGVVVVELINCKSRGILRNEIW